MKFKTVAAAALLAISPLAAAAGSLAVPAEPVVTEPDDVLAAPSLGSFGLGGGAVALAAIVAVAALAASDSTSGTAE